MILENCEVLGHHDADQVLDPASTTLWFTVKQMQNDKLLKVGRFFPITKHIFKRLSLGL